MRAEPEKQVRMVDVGEAVTCRAYDAALAHTCPSASKGENWCWARARTRWKQARTAAC